jgi:hypothetical protein
VGGPLLISNPNVVSSFHGLQGSSPPLFSLGSSNPSNGDHDDDVMSLDESDPTPKINLLIVPSKLIVQKKNYDVSKKLQDSWATKLLWAKFCLGSNGNLHTIKCRIYNEVEGKNEIFFIKWDSFSKHVGRSKAEKEHWNWGYLSLVTSAPTIFYFYFFFPKGTI